MHELSKLLTADDSEHIIFLDLFACHVTWNSINDATYNPHGFNDFCQGIQSNRYLRKLSFDNNGFDINGSDTFVLSANLALNSSLLYLSLANRAQPQELHNNLTTSGVIALAAMAIERRSTFMLNICGNRNIGLQAWMALLVALRVNPNLILANVELHKQDFLRCMLYEFEIVEDADQLDISIVSGKDSAREISDELSSAGKDVASDKIPLLDVVANLLKLFSILSYTENSDDSVEHLKTLAEDCQERARIAQREISHRDFTVAGSLALNPAETDNLKALYDAELDNDFLREMAIATNRGEAIINTPEALKYAAWYRVLTNCFSEV